VRPDIDIVDEYLGKWDAFAQGAHALVPYLNENLAMFEDALARLLDAGDPRAPSRMVFYPVVQVGGFIDLNSPVGQAALRLLGPGFPVHRSDEKGGGYFAGDLYFWWQRERGSYERFSLFEEWENRDFAKTVAIPMYRAARGKT
jgi:hypothetical protein